MTPKRFGLLYEEGAFDMMSDLEKMVMEDIAFYHSEGNKALLFSTKEEIDKMGYLSHNTIHYSKAVTDYWSDYFDKRP